MTDKPTDEALENLFVEETGFDIDDFPAAIFGFARAVLAKWGQPAQAVEAVAREPLPKFLALKFHARRDKKATVTLLFPGHEAADAWVRGIKGGQHDAE